MKQKKCCYCNKPSTFGMIHNETKKMLCGDCIAGSITAIIKKVAWPQAVKPVTELKEIVL